MKAIPKLNRSGRRRWGGLSVMVVFAAASIGLLQWRLAAIYARPTAVALAAPASPPSRQEDAKLFAQALAAGLLRPETDGRIMVAPADLPLRQTYAREHPELLAPHSGAVDWLAGAWNEDSQRLHRMLHFSATGRYVRQQVEDFNAHQLLAAIRWRSDSGLTGRWRANWGGAALALAVTLPPSIDRFLAETPGNWQPWQWVTRWPAVEGRPPVRFRLTPARPVRAGEPLELLLVGAAPAVEGATVVDSEPLCAGSSPCAEPEAVAHRLTLEWRAGASELTVSGLPLPAMAFPEFGGQQISPIRREGGRLLWRGEPGEAGVLWRPRPVGPLSVWPADSAVEAVPPADRSGSAGERA